MTSTRKISKGLTSILSNLNNFHSLEVVDRVSETQLQVGENSNWIIWRIGGSHNSWTLTNIETSLGLKLVIFLNYIAPEQLHVPVSTWHITYVGGVLGWLLVVVLFAPIRGGSLGICFVCWMLLRHCTEALVYSNHPRAAAASSYLAIIFGRIASGVPWFLRSTAEPMQHPHQCWRWCRPW